MPDKRPNDAQLRLNARAPNSNAVENVRMQMREKARRSKNQRRTAALSPPGGFFYFVTAPERETIFHRTSVRSRAAKRLLLEAATAKTEFYPGFLSPPSHSLSLSLSTSVFVSPHLAVLPAPASQDGNVPRAMKMIKRQPESRQSRSNPAPKAKSETPAVL